MSLISKIPIQSTLKKRRIPNAFMLFVKDQKEQLVQKCPEESMTVIGTILSKKWKAMGLDEKRVYYDKCNALQRRYEDSSALSSTKEEGSMDKDLIKEIGEINKMEAIPLDRKQNKSSIKNPDDSSDFTTVLENQPDNTTKSKNRSKSSKPSKLKEGKRKAHGLKNPFLIFAREQRRNIKSGKKSHASTILGNMWHELDSSEKKKYFEKAQRPYSISSSVLVPDGKSRNKTKKKRGPKPRAHPPHASENGVSSSKDTAVIPDKSEKKENLVNIESTVVDPPPDSKPCPHGAVYNAFKLPQPEMNNASVMPYSPNMGGFYRPSFYPPDPMSCMPFWMYQQPMFPHHYYPFTSYHSHCHCCPLPYHGYQGLGAASHFRSVIYGRTSAPYSSVSAAGASSDAGNDVHDDRQDDVSDDGENRLVIVDDVQSETSEHA